MEKVWGPFQNSWNQLVGHHYIKVVLLDRCTRALSGNAGNYEEVVAALEHAAGDGKGK